jgi:hypothetical protein
LGCEHDRGRYCYSGLEEAPATLSIYRLWYPVNAIGVLPFNSSTA